MPSPSSESTQPESTSVRPASQYGFPPQWLEFLIESALRFPDGEPWPHALPDPDDARFLSLAYKTGAWLITGNLKH
jgi:uncharacterized protein